MYRLYIMRAYDSKPLLVGEYLSINLARDAFKRINQWDNQRMMISYTPIELINKEAA